MRSRETTLRNLLLRVGLQAIRVARQATALDGAPLPAAPLCPSGHALRPLTLHTDVYTCDLCNKEKPVGTVMQSCSTCDYDVCTFCAGHGFVPPALPLPAAEAAPAAATANGSGSSGRRRARRYTTVLRTH